MSVAASGLADSNHSQSNNHNQPHKIDTLKHDDAYTCNIDSQSSNDVVDRSIPFLEPTSNSVSLASPTSTSTPTPPIPTIPTNESSRSNTTGSYVSDSLSGSSFSNSSCIHSSSSPLTDLTPSPPPSQVDHLDSDSHPHNHPPHDEDEVDALEATDDIQDAITKTALCATLFSLTRANRVPINYANTLSKAMCNSSTTLREFERLRNEIAELDREAARLDALQPTPVRRTGFFGRLSKSTPPSSHVAATKLKTEEMMWQFVRGKMEALMIKQHTQIHSPPFPSLSRPPSISARPLPIDPPPISSIGSLPSAPSTRSNSIGGMTLASLPLTTSPPPTSMSMPPTPNAPQSPLVHGALGPSASFAPYLIGQSSPSTSGASTPTSRYSPRRIWRTLFYSSSAASTPVLVPTPSPQPIPTEPIVAEPTHAQHFDSFPKIDQILKEIVDTPLPRRVLRWSNEKCLTRRVAADSTPHRSTDVLHAPHAATPSDSTPAYVTDVPTHVPFSSDSLHTPLVLHRECFPQRLSTPLNRIDLSETDVDIEQECLDTWTDVLFNYRKHIPRCSKEDTKDLQHYTIPSILLQWWLTSWKRIEQEAAEAEAEAKKEQQQTNIKTMNENNVLDDSFDILSPEVDPVDIVGTTSPSILSGHLRLLLMLHHWLLLCPFDFRCDDSMVHVTLRSHLSHLRERYASRVVPHVNDDDDDHGVGGGGDDDVDVLAYETNLSTFIRSIEACIPTSNVNDSDDTLCSSTQHRTSSSTTTTTPTTLLPPIDISPSPLQLLPFPFSDEVDCIYSSNLFAYTPVELARELMLHSYDLFRKIPIHEWFDGGWQKKGASGGGGTEPYTNAYSRATEQQAAGGGGTGAGEFSVAPDSSTHTSRFIGDFNRLVYWISTEILHPRLSSKSRQDLILYFLEVGMISLKLHHNFHVTFAISAAFQTQHLYRLKEVQNLKVLEVRYRNDRIPSVQKAMEEEEIVEHSNNNNNHHNNATIITDDTPDTTPDRTTMRRRCQVKNQYEELRTVTSSRNNYACYRGLISSLLGDAYAPGSSNLGRGTSPASSPSQSSVCSSRRMSSASASGDGYQWNIASPTHPTRQTSGETPPVGTTSNNQTPQIGPESGPANGLQAEFRLDGLYESIPTATLDDSASVGSSSVASPASVPLASWPSSSSPPCVPLIPHLAVHLKDLTYSQELSGVEKQWAQQQIQQQQTNQETTDDQNESNPDPLAPPLDSSSSPSPSPPVVFCCRFDRSRWHRTSRLVCSLLRLQRLPVFPTLLGQHSPPLYTLLQVHLLTHVLPESELLQLSLAIAPRVDRTKLQQAQKSNKTINALREEGFL